MPGRLAILEDQNGTPFIHYNLGVRGQTIREISSRAVQECSARLMSKDDFIVFATGSNDFAITETGIPRTPQRRAMKQFRELIITLKEIAPLLVFGPTPVYEEKLPFFSALTNMSFDFKNDILMDGTKNYKSICAEEGVSFIDMHAALSNREVFLEGLAKNDGLHSTGKGYQAMAATIMNSQEWKTLLHS